MNYMNDPFLQSAEWRTIRMRVLERDGAKCACCGRTVNDGVRMNVDHIKPRARYPELALDVDNLQVLCHECNHGNGNKFETDWRSLESEQKITRRSPTESASWRALRVLAFRPTLLASFDVKYLDDELLPFAEALKSVGATTQQELQERFVLAYKDRSVWHSFLARLRIDTRDWEDSYDANAELAGLVQRFKRDREYAALRAIVRIGSPEDWSQQIKEVADFRAQGDVWPT